jgi:NAD(P)H dehydrogenase (quinone)
MKVLIVHAHAEEKSFCSALRNKAVEVLKGKGCDVKVSNLYEMKYYSALGPEDFVSMDPTYFKPQNEQVKSNQANFAGFSDQTKEEHLKLQWADLVLFVFPLYWFHLPGILKNWIDRTFSMGFGYGNGKIMENGLFKGKKAMVVFTTGAPSNMLDGFNLKQSLFYQLNVAIFKFCGMDALEPFVAYSAAHVDDTQRKQYLLEFENIMKSIETRALYNPESIKVQVSVPQISVAIPQVTAPTVPAITAQCQQLNINKCTDCCKVKLTYFEFPGRGEQVRCLLKYAKVSFEDNRISFQKWGEEKKSGKYEYEQLPSLEWHGKVLAQTPAIMQFLAEKLNFMPSDPMMKYEAIATYTAVVDIFNTYASMLTEKNSEAKEAKKKDYYGSFIPFMFGKFEQRLKKQMNKQFMIGQSITYVDFAFAGFAKGTFLNPQEADGYEPTYKNTPLLKAYLDNLMKICN